MQRNQVLSFFFSLLLFFTSLYNKAQCVTLKGPQNKRSTHLVVDASNENTESLAEKYKKSLNFLNVLNEEARENTERLSEALHKLGDKISDLLTDKLVTFLQYDDNLNDLNKKESEEKLAEDVSDLLESDIEETDSGGVTDSSDFDLGDNSFEEVEIPEDLGDISEKVSKDDLKEIKKVIVDNTLHELTEDLDNWDLGEDKNSDIEEDIEQFTDNVVQGLVKKYDARKLEKDIKKHDLLDFMNENIKKSK